MKEREQTLADEVAELEGRRGTAREVEGFTRIGRLKPRQREARAVLSVRMNSSEMREIAEACGVLERNVSEFIREAALKEARQVRAGIEEARRAVLAKGTASL
jgi:uncharacterized protein (DUF1778 family)